MFPIIVFTLATHRHFCSPLRWENAGRGQEKVSFPSKARISYFRCKKFLFTQAQKVLLAVGPSTQTQNNTSGDRKSAEVDVPFKNSLLNRGLAVNAPLHHFAPPLIHPQNAKEVSDPVSLPILSAVNAP